MREEQIPLLVNAAHAYAGKPMDLVAVDAAHPDILLCRAAQQALNGLLAAIGGVGKILPVSGYRPRSEQEAIYTASLRENGREFTRKYVALPGHSEHETGLAIDLGENKPPIDFIRPAFPDSGICGQFKARAAEFGFILRYPADKEAVTGIAHEPWHFRYVGPEHAQAMAREGLTLEEYVARLLKTAR
ncbi:MULTISPECIES: M15 family metallopeptidase [unclassified Clostridium]|uniref:M15 family metallopeptidase n=1 Tax=unclassified Clostridium TaxID=2614128 RepID=UPI0011060DF0|nr:MULTISPECIES: M15 family metallopeptidase [unclassified Clostridium]